MRWRRRQIERRLHHTPGTGAVCAAVILLSTAVHAADAPPPQSAAGLPGAAAPTGVAYWQAPPLPNAVIEGGAIPPGWQPQAVPYQGMGPDGQPITMYFAPTYVFTYQAGPPVWANPAVTRGMPVNRTPPALTATTGGWNYATSGAPPAPTTLAPGAVTRYRAAYRLPPDARALAGAPLVPPGPLPQQPALPVQAWAAAPVAPSPVAAPMMAPPPTQWAAASPQQLPVEPLAAAALTGATAAAIAAPPPPPALPPMAAMPPPKAPVLEPLPPQPTLSGTAPPPPRALAARAWRVVGVYDGDSLTCLDENSQQQKVRLAGIDAPENGQPHAPESRDALAALVFGRTVEVVDNGRDAAGRVIASVAINGSDVSRQLVATGNAWVAPTSTDTSLAAAQSAAQASKLGIWAAANPTAPWNYRSGS